MKQIRNFEDEDEYGTVCARCWHSVCDPLEEECINEHPGDKDRWCHKHNKSVWNLQDASKCKDFDCD